jgi:dihydrofolate reductase/thymidylate synthase
MKKFNIIIATDINGGIGFNGKIPWNFSMDMEYFKNITKNHSILPGINKSDNILIMGRKTWESLGKKSLPGRISFVISSDYINLNKTFSDSKIKFYPDFLSAYIISTIYSESDVWIIGGKEIYNTALRHWACDQVYWTEIKGEFETDVKINMSNYKINWINSLNRSETNKSDGKTYELIFHQGKVIPNVEAKYLASLYDVITDGESRETRNGITQSKFGSVLSWDLADGFPLLTTKKMFWKAIVEELLFFIRGDTNTNLLSQKGIKIWEGNTSKEFLDKMGFNYPVGEMGPMYGYQWRHFGKPYPETDENSHVKGVDQLIKIINEIKSDPHSRRIMMTDFNPAQAHQGVLYPCHSIVIQFYVESGKLSCSMYQRSCDEFIGKPFNIASTSLLLHIIAQLTGLNIGSVHLILGDYHIYEEHHDAVMEQLARTPYNLPRLVLPELNTLEQVENSNWTDYKLIGYQSHEAIKAKMIA